jgi:hypothetical protein
MLDETIRKIDSFSELLRLNKDLNKVYIMYDLINQLTQDCKM